MAVHKQLMSHGAAHDPRAKARHMAYMHCRARQRLLPPWRLDLAGVLHKSLQIIDGLFHAHYASANADMRCAFRLERQALA